MPKRITQTRNRVLRPTPLTSLATFAAACAVLFTSACGPTEEELELVALTEDLASANTAIDSLNYTVESSNLLIDEMRSRVDSLQYVDQKLLESVQRLNREVRQWQELAGEQKRMNAQLTDEIERMKRDKQSDQRSIARLRGQADSINTALLDAHTGIRRQEDHIKRMELDLSQSLDEVAALRQAETSVRVYAIKRLDPTDPRVQLAPLGEPLRLEGEVDTYVDRFGTLKKGKSYTSSKSEGGVEVIFTDDLLGGSDVLVVLKE